MFTKTRFDSWDLPENILGGLSAIEWEFATQVQKDTIPLARQGRDVIGQALILAPTRELANQVAEEFQTLQGDSGLSIQTVYGGTDLEKQAKKLSDGVDIIVGTPGRVMDMTDRGHINLDSPVLFCLDEAGFFPDIMWVVERMNNREQTLLFSATFPQEIIDAAHEFMNDPEFVLTNSEELDIPPIEMFSVSVGRANKLWALGRLLIRMEENDQTIIFCNTKRMVDLAVQRLKKHRFDAEGLHGDLNQNQRERILNRFKEGEVKTIVATDVAARGIDVDGITLVVNYDLPADLDSFIHRVGRTGRIGRKGEAWSLVSRDDAPQLSKIMATYGLDIVSTEAPELPSGVERDPVNRQDDFGETADVFGFVTLQLNIAQSDAGSSRTVAQWFQNSLRCDEMAIGDVHFDAESTFISIHTSKVGLALKALDKHEMAGKAVSGIVVE